MENSGNAFQGTFNYSGAVTMVQKDNSRTPVWKVSILQQMQLEQRKWENGILVDGKVRGSIDKIAVRLLCICAASPSPCD